MNCDMCGKNTNLFITNIEGAKMQLCKECASYGKVLGNVKTREEKILEEERIKKILDKGKKSNYKDFETHETLATNFGQIIRKKRESLQITQTEFAKMLNIKESEIHHMEHGDFKPQIELARKIEKMLKVTLIVKEDSDVKMEKGVNGAMTIGDLLKFKK